MPDYSNGYIYMIVNSVNDDIYVGSSCVPLNERLSNHFGCARDIRRDSLLYRTMRALGESCFSIVKLEDFPCDNNQELKAEEECYRVDLNAELNMNRCIQTKEQAVASKAKWFQDNKLRILAQHRQYCENNKEKLSLHMKKYYIDNKVEILKRSADYYSCHQHSKKLRRQQTILDQVHYCDICDIARESKSALKKHTNTLKHRTNVQNTLKQ